MGDPMPHASTVLIIKKKVKKAEATAVRAVEAGELVGLRTLIPVS